MRITLWVFPVGASCFILLYCTHQTVSPSVWMRRGKPDFTRKQRVKSASDMESYPHDFTKSRKTKRGQRELAVVNSALHSVACCCHFVTVPAWKHKKGTA